MAFDLEEVIESAVARGVRRALEELRPAIQEPELLTVAEAAKRAKVSEDTIRRWMDDGLLNTYGSAHAKRVRSDELLTVRPKMPEPEKSTQDRVAALLNRKRG